MNHPRLIVGMTGRYESGKDTFAQQLTQSHGFVRDAIADDIRAAALTLNPLIGYVGGTARLSVFVHRLGWDRAKRTPEVRRILQVLGSEVGWMMHGKLLWVHRVEQRIDKLPAGTPAVITDVRFPVEREWLRERGGVLIEVVRPGHLPANAPTASHSSEIHTNSLDPDIVVVNDTTIADLHAKADRLIDQIYELSGLSSHLG